MTLGASPFSEHVQIGVELYPGITHRHFRPSNMGPSPGIGRALSSVSLEGIPSVANGNGKRIKALSEEQKEAIRSLQKPQDLPYPERKRQFAALGRRLEKPCPPGVLAKWEAATTDDAKPLTFQFMFN